ncbi:methyltransferase domain-containing protein [Trichothermofontia sichuanensis B231]|uniref:methyltransferase domain-containing protein n=1 Tax=Trichothermofontia sichuanensis TaxID=3045816 RepID=UPI00224515F3|nr:methyltransferase domain-containing protein [Trichothermofontia sichuanensis]UZQ55087.1 methyltransferase domain-containing protein [Trichothermofontia sichuanensis B231]
MLHFLWSGFFLSEKSYQEYEIANREIAKWAEYYLSQKIAFNQSHWFSGKVTENPNDILLGHPTWDLRTADERELLQALKHDWVRDNALSPDQDCHPNTYILMPWVPEFPPDWTAKMPFFEQQLLAAKKIFALCGQIWIDRTATAPVDSIQYRVKDKLIHCNMGVATQNLPIVKQRFNAIGERQILHISNLAQFKGFDITCESVQGLDTLLHVASLSLQANVGLLDIIINGKKYVINFLGGINNSDPAFNQWVVDNCDFYIHTAWMDAQATTILENAARGLIPLVTPESGFASPHAIYLTHDPDNNREIIRWALNLPESELLERSRLIREQIQREHNWEDIYTTIWNSIVADMEARSRSSQPSPQVFFVTSSTSSANQLQDVNVETVETSPSHQKARTLASAMDVDQRLYISRQHLFELERQIRLERHVERYALLRQFAKGVVCDAACGCGYGSYLLSTNPDVTVTIGLDMSPDAIAHARQEYASDKTEFHVADLSQWTSDRPIDMLISVETIEHIPDRSVLPQFVDRNQINHVILTYPSKKTTHYNRFHHHDFKLQDILDIFPDFTCYRHFNWEYEFDVVFLLRHHYSNHFLAS